MWGITRAELERTLDWEAGGLGSTSQPAADSQGLLASCLGLKFSIWAAGTKWTYKDPIM